MDALPLLRPDAPFTPLQIQQVNQLFQTLTPQQRFWLGGYLSALSSAASDVVAPAERAKLTILFASESGNAESLAALARRKANKLGFSAKVSDVAALTPEIAAQSSHLLIVASTWGEGDPPQRAAAFHRTLLSADISFAQTHYAVLALGDRAYVNFCETGKQIDERLSSLGGQRVADRVDCDLDYQSAADTWLDATLAALLATVAPSAVASSATVPATVALPTWGDQDEADAPPIEADLEITTLINLNSSRSDIVTHHVELDLGASGITFQPGDALSILPDNDPITIERVLLATGLAHEATLLERIGNRHDITTITRPQIARLADLTGDAALNRLLTDEADLGAYLADRHFVDVMEAVRPSLDPDTFLSLLRPLPPRLYSVASSLKSFPGEAHLLIGLLDKDVQNERRHGVASSHVAHRSAVGRSLRVGVKRNPHFRLPADSARPIIMVGAGTGIAPFRAFLQEREADGATGLNWLIFGHRRYLHDFLYQLEWQEYLQQGTLARLDLAFSRDQPSKIYVQYRLWAQRDTVYQWLQDGAIFYVCGDAKHMARDVHETLRRIVEDQGRLSPGKAEEWLLTAQQDGRYLRDIY